MAVQTLNYQTALTTVETITSGVPAAASNQTVTQSGYNTTLSLSSSTTPPVASGSKSVVTISSGSASIDLTNLVGAGGVTVSGSGLRVRAIKFKASSSNAASLTIAVGGSNGYTGLGSSFTVTLPIGGEFVWYDNGNGTLVSSTVKTLAVTGTGSTDNLTLEVVFGT